MIRKISAIDGYPDLYKQTYRPGEKDKMLKTLSMIKQMAERLPLYEMHCTISEEGSSYGMGEDEAIRTTCNEIK